MRDWNITTDGPLILTLAADARLAPTDYSDDQIWQLSFRGGDPPAVSLYTTFGLRARSMRMFPRFVIGDDEVANPQDFIKPPVLRRFYANYALLEFSPFTPLDVQMELWVPESHGIASRIILLNKDDQACKVSVDWICQLTPTEGERMAPMELQAVSFLAGQTGELAPVVFQTGGPKVVSSPYPALCREELLEPGETSTYTWVQAARSTPQESFDLARHLASRSWEAEVARIELVNSNMVEIHTGDPDWDLAFALSQVNAAGLLVGPTNHLPGPALVATRLPDEGYSLRGDGSDYDHLWNGSTLLEIFYLAGIFLPGGVELVKDLVTNYLSVQSEDGFIDQKPGLAGQRSRLLAPPLLANLAWGVYQHTQDKDYLAQVFPGLFRFVQYWFAPECDRDGDGIPEWDHPLQIGMGDHPIFSPWYHWSIGLDMFTAESPALCALLYQECQVLLHMSTVLGEIGPRRAIKMHIKQLKAAIEAGWDESSAVFCYWDRDTHVTPALSRLVEQTGSGRANVDREFDPPLRLLVHIYSELDTKPQPTVFIHGESSTGQHRVERLEAEHFRWQPGRGVVTGERVYRRLEFIDFKGVHPGDLVVVYAAGYQGLDHSMYLPLWSGMLSEERAQKLVDSSLLAPEQSWRPFGIPACADPPLDIQDATPENACSMVHLPWNALICEGLISYGRRAEAAELVSRLMSAITKSLKREGYFRRYYHADTGQGSSERDALEGLAPVGAFLQALGVQVISPNKVILEGNNPFPWPVTVKYKGLTVLRQEQKTNIVFPDGQTAVVDDPSRIVVALESG